MHPAFLTEVVPEEASDKQIIQTPSPKKHHQKHSSPRKEEVIQPPPKQPAKTADDLLDEMLGLGDSNTITTKGMDLKKVSSKKSKFGFLRIVRTGAKL